jgi:hypothetical protein
MSNPRRKSEIIGEILILSEKLFIASVATSGGVPDLFCVYEAHYGPLGPLCLHRFVLWDVVTFRR